MAGKRRRKGRRKKRRPHLLKRGVQVGVAAGVLFFAWLLWPYWSLSGQFSDEPARQPSRLYGRSTLLAEDELGSPQGLAEELSELGYRSLAPGEPVPPGAYRRQGDTVAVYLRPFLSPAGRAGGELLKIRFRGRRIDGLTQGGRSVSSTLLEPPLLASYYGPQHNERRPVAVDEVSEDLVRAVLAAEDDSFFEHTGFSVTAMLRAAWANLRGGGIRQGGSTLTQQLVKNLYLSPERTLVRKLREVVLAVLLELRYDKRAILEAYLNEIYLGHSGEANLLGVGVAARAYFGKDVAQLGLAEAATLAGMIRAPARYSPVKHPERAKQRRDWVLGRMEELGWAEAERAERARQEPVRVSPEPMGLRRAPYFAHAMALEAAERFGLADLADAGYTLLSTLDWEDQQEAEAAVGWGLEALEDGWERGRRTAGPLQGALVSVDPRSGAILAYVGGRDYGQSQFDRAGLARRQAGSAFKPVVYAAVFESGRAAPSSLVEDAPLTVELAGRTWEPHNDDGEYLGWISARTALEESRNVATARLALAEGLPRVVDLARRLGISSRLQPVPSLALGAFEVSPVELATVYATFAGGGLRPPVHGLVAVFDREGHRLQGESVAVPERVLSPQASYLVTSVLQGVLDRGTGQGARRQGLEAALAGKTGTTNGRRDSWFAGYSPDRASVVWVGYDDNSRTRLSGARAALPIWTRFAYAVRPPGGYPFFAQPPGIATAVIDPESGELATESCPQVLTEVFRQDQVPTHVCHLHGGWLPELAGHRAERARRPSPFRRWLRKVFGNEGSHEREDRP